MNPRISSQAIVALCLSFISLLVFGISSARAQETAGTFDALRQRVSAGDKVRVIDSSGNLTEGEVVEIKASSLVLRSRNNRQVFSEETVREVRKRERDSLWNGILIGAGAGVAAGAITTAQVCGTNDSECTSIAGTAFIGAGAGIGIAAGALVDRSIRKFRTVFTSTGTAGSPRISLIPAFARDQKAFQLSFIF